MIGMDPLSTFAFVPPSFSYKKDLPKLVTYCGEFEVWGEPIQSKISFFNYVSPSVPRRTSITYVGSTLDYQSRKNSGIWRASILY